MSDKTKVILKHAAIYAATTVFMFAFVWMATIDKVWL